MMESLGRVASSPHSSVVRVSTITARLNAITPGMHLRFTSSADHGRTGYATVRDVDYERGELSFDTTLAAMVPAVCENDYIYEYVQPCTRCHCPQCDAAFAELAVLKRSADG